MRVCERNKLVSSEVTNRDDYLSEELSSEEDIPEENIVEVQCILIDHGLILFIDSIRLIVDGLYKNVSGMILVIFRDRQPEINH